MLERLRKQVKRLIARLYPNPLVPSFVWEMAGVLNPFLGLLRRKGLPGIAAPAAGTPRVLFLRMRFVNRFQAMEMALAQQLAQQGADCVFAYCSSILPICNGWDVRSDDGLADCHYCSRNNTALARLSPFRSVTLDRYVTEDDIAQARLRYTGTSIEALQDMQLDGLPIHDELYRSVAKFVFRGEITDTPFHRGVVSDFAVAAGILERGLRAMIAREKPDVVVMNCGHIFWYGIAYAILKQLGIRTVTYDEVNINVVKLGWIFDDRNPCVDFVWHDLWERRKHVPLTEPQADAVRELIEARRASFMYQKDPTVAPISSKHDLSRFRLTFSLFTNILWDATIVGKNPYFPSLLHWVQDTLDFFAGHPDCCLVIRVHPAEAGVYGLPSKERVLEALHLEEATLPPNIFIVRAEEKISSYDLIDQSDVVLCYASNVGFEAAMFGKTVVVAGPAHYSDKGFAIEPKSREEYGAVLARLVQGTESLALDRELLMRYAWFAYIDSQIDLGLFLDRHPTTVSDLTFQDFGDLSSARYENLRAVARWIAAGDAGGTDGFLTNSGLAGYRD